MYASDAESCNKGLMNFTMILYSNHHDSSVADIGTLRWYLFAKHNYTANQLPPTWGALRYHILRANCVSVTW